MRSIRTMLLALLLAAGALAGSGSAHAQGCGSFNPNCIVPTAPAGTNNNQAASTAFVHGAIAAIVSGWGTGVAAALAINIGSAGAPVLFNGALGSPSSIGTLPAFTLGGTIAGGGNQINNIIIGTSTPLAGFFTTLEASGNVGFGTETNPQAPFVVSKNVTTGISNFLAGTTVAFIGVDGTNNATQILAYGAQPIISARRADGTAASPTAVGAATTFFNFQAGAYDGSAYQTTAGIRFDTVNAQSGSDRSSAIHFRTTPIGSTAIGDTLVVNGTGLAATSTTVAAAVLTGGLGVSDKIFAGSDINSAGSFVSNTAAKTLVLKQGANGAVGTFICTSGGSITVTNTNVAISDGIGISLNTVGGSISAPPFITAITASTSFVAKCATSDTSTYNYWITKNAAWLLNRDLDPTANDNFPAFMEKAA